MLVPSSKVNEARVAAGKAGVGGDRADWSLLDKSSLSQTDGQWQMKVQRVRSEMLATQIEEHRRRLPRDRQPGDPRAQRVQRRPGADARLGQASTRCGGIARPTRPCAASSRWSRTRIPGLTPQNISVIDQNGRRCPTRPRRSASPPPTRWRPSARGRTPQTAIAQATLDKMVGVGAGSAIVAGQLNFDETTEKSQTFGDSKGAITEATEKEKLKQAGGANGRRHRHDRESSPAPPPRTAARARSTRTTRRPGRTPSTPRRPRPRRSAARPPRCPSRRRLEEGAEERQRRRDHREQIIQDTIADAIGLDTEDPTNKIRLVGRRPPEPGAGAEGRRRHGRRRRRGRQERQRARAG